MIFRGVSLPSMFLSYQWGHWIFCLRGGGDVVIGYSVFFFFFVVLFMVVLVLVVCSIVSSFRILVVFCF